MKLQVWWIPQIPMKAFRCDVPNFVAAKVLLNALAAYDLFQFENNVKPDFANAGGLNVWDEELDGINKWTAWYDESRCCDIDELTLAECAELDWQLAVATDTAIAKGEGAK